MPATAIGSRRPVGVRVSVKTRLGVVLARLLPYASHPREARGCDRRRKSAASKSAEAGRFSRLGGDWTWGKLIGGIDLGVRFPPGHA